MHCTNSNTIGINEHLHGWNSTLLFWKKKTPFWLFYLLGIHSIHSCSCSRQTHLASEKNYEFLGEPPRFYSSWFLYLMPLPPSARFITCFLKTKRVGFLPLTAKKLFLGDKIEQNPVDESNSFSWILHFCHPKIDRTLSFEHARIYKYYEHGRLPNVFLWTEAPKIWTAKALHW